MTAVCPVHFCHPKTALAASPKKGRVICDRHLEQVCEPMRRQLDGARARGDHAEAGKILAQAVVEARRNDHYWHPYAVRVGKRAAEPFETFPEAVHRWSAIGGTAVLISATKNRVVEHDEVLTYCPYLVEVDGREIAKGSNLSKAITAACQALWPPGTPPLARRVFPPTTVWVNDITGDRYSFKEAADIATRGMGAAA